MLLHLQGDIVAIFDSNSAAVVQYKYDAWGRQISCDVAAGNSNATALSTLNPSRYRGYVYDEETSLYYLRSRYYISSVQRFLNADESFVEKNKYSYCKNSPVSRRDLDGHCTTCAVTHTDYEIVYDVPVYSQGATNLCWAYCQVMREEYEKKCQLGADYSFISQADADARAIVLAEQRHQTVCAVFYPDCSLEPAQHAGWPTNISSSSTQQFYTLPTIQDLYTALEERGPLLLTYSETVESSGKTASELVGHGVLATGVNLYSKKVLMVNPWGVAGWCSYESLARGYIYWPDERKKIGLPIYSTFSMPFSGYAYFDE